MNFERKTFDAQPYLYVSCETTYDGPAISQAMGQGFRQVFGLVGEAGITPQSMPIAVYLGMDKDVMRFRAGVMVSEEDADKANGTVLADRLPSGDAMTTLHTGPYAALKDTHKALWDHMEASDIKGTMPVWEIYVDDPDEVEEGKLRTEIYAAID